MLQAFAFLPPRLPPLFPGYSSRRAPAREASDGTTFSFRLVLCEGKASKEKPHLHAKVAATDDIHPLSPARRRVHTVPPYALRASAALEPEFLVRVSAPVLGGFCWSELTCVPSWLLALSVPLAASSPPKLMSFQARATIAPTLSRPHPPTPGKNPVPSAPGQAGEPSTQPITASDIQPVFDHRPTDPAGAVTPGPSQDDDRPQVISRVKAIQVPGHSADGPAGTTSATNSERRTSGTNSERRTSNTTTSTSARTHAEDLVCFPPQFPLDNRGGALGKLSTLLAPRFADQHFERRYHQHRGQGLDSVLLVFWSLTAAFVLTMWGYHATSANGLDRVVQIGMSLVHGQLLFGLVFWAVLRFLPGMRVYSSALLGLLTCMLTTLFTWGLPSTARETCQDVYNTFDSNLHQTVFTCICFAAVFCRVGTGAFAMVCLVTFANLCAAAPPSELQPLEPQP